MKFAIALLCSLAAAPAMAQTTNVFGIDFTANNGQAVSGATHARLRYNSGTGVIEVSYAGAAYTALVPASVTETLAQTYAAGSGTASSIMLLDSTRGPVIVRDNAVTIGTLFGVQNSAGNGFLTITANARNFIRSGLADGAASVSLAVDTISSWSNATAKLLQVLTANSERFSISSAGNLNLVAGATLAGAGTVNYNSAVADSGAAVGHSFDTTNAFATDGDVAFRIRSGGADWFTAGRNASARKFIFFGDADATGSGPLVVKSTASSVGVLFDATTAGGRMYQVYSTTTGLLALADFTAGLNRWQMDASGHFSPFADAAYDLGIDATNRVRKLAVTQINERAATSQTAATQAWRDSANSARFGVDSSGLPSLGSRFEFREDWLWTASGAGASTTLAASQTNTVINNNTTWSYTSTANATGFTNTSGFATGTPVQSGITIGSGTANTNSTLFKQNTAFIVFNVTNTVIVAEWQMAMDVIGANSATMAAGITNNGVNAAHPGGYYFQKASANTNWQCMTDTGAAGPTAADSGVPPVASTAQMMRIEVYGSGTPIGATTAKYYIGSTLVCTTTTNVFTGGSMLFTFYNTATAATTQRNLSVGPLLLMFNQVPSALIP
jgi:hypothetical protein